MSFQWIFNQAETFSINRKQQIATTTARDGTIRAVSRGTPFKRFTVKLPDGIAWSYLRSAIVGIEAQDRIATEIITIDYNLWPWYYNYVNSGIESYRVRIIEFPEWTIFAQNQVSWSGPFVFQEATV
jgi:hypothetical protein